MKLFVKGREIQPVTSWSFETITDALDQAREEFRQTGSESAAKECEYLYKLKKQMDDWTK